jgi:hypothetical protein
VSTSFRSSNSALVSDCIFLLFLEVGGLPMKDFADFLIDRQLERRVGVWDLGDQRVEGLLNRRMLTNFGFDDDIRQSAPASLCCLFRDSTRFPKPVDSVHRRQRGLRPRYRAPHGSPAHAALPLDESNNSRPHPRLPTYRHIRIKLAATSTEEPAFIATSIGPSI